MKAFASISLTLSLALSGLAFAYGAAADTGTRLDRTSQPRQVVWFDTPSELRKAIRFIRAGEHQRAINEVAPLLNVDMPPVYRYLALNAMCVAHSSAGEIDAAIANCDEAIALMPFRWEAYNSRGTAHYVSGDYEAALADYREVLTRNPALPVVEHNIALAESRLGG